MTSPGLNDNEAVLFPQRIVRTPPGWLRISADCSFPFFHWMLTSQPPRVRKPLTEPSVQPLGSAGNKLISPAWLCSSDSATPAVKPKLASDWLAPLLCRFGATALATNAEINAAALS